MSQTVEYESCWIESSLLRKSNPLALVSLSENYSLFQLVPESEQQLWMYPEDLLLRWVHYHIKKVNSSLSVRNFTTDWSDCEIFTILFSQLFSGFNGSDVLAITDRRARAEALLNKVNPLLSFSPSIHAKDIYLSDFHQIIFFLAQIFNSHSGLPEPSEFDKIAAQKKIDELIAKQEKEEAESPENDAEKALELSKKKEEDNEKDPSAMDIEESKESASSASSSSSSSSSSIGAPLSKSTTFGREAPAIMMLKEKEDKQIKEEQSEEEIKKEEDYKKWVKELGLKAIYRDALLSNSDTSTASFDRCLAWMMVAIRFDDLSLFRRNIDKVDSLLATDDSSSSSSSSAGNARGLEIDWERKNRLIAFRGVFALLSRHFAAASSFFHSSLSTFVCPELFGDMQHLVICHVCSSLVSLPREEIKAKCIEQPDVTSVIHQVPALQKALNSFYNGDYSTFFVSLNTLTSDILQSDKFFSQHATYFCKEMRAKAYSQYIIPYNSVYFNKMASLFGVSPQFLESDLERFITSGKVPAKIDKVGGRVISKRSEWKGVQLDGILASGDDLINRMQKMMGAIVYT